MKNSDYICVFCGHAIDRVLPNPCFLDLSTSRDPKEVQGLYCHAACLNRVATPDFPLLTKLE